MKNFIVVLHLVFTALFVSGCVAPIQYTWYKPGVNEENTKTYYRECEYNVGMNKLSPAKEQQLMDACMEKEGFRWVARH